MTRKTLALKVLESNNIPYRVYTYPDTLRDAVEIARLLGISAERVFKTLVALPANGKPMLVMIPGSYQLNLKMLATETGHKKVKLASHAQAENLTGLEVGGISALALQNRGFQILLDRSAFVFDTICVSGGRKGINVEMEPAKLREVTGAVLVDVIS